MSEEIPTSTPSPTGVQAERVESPPPEVAEAISKMRSAGPSSMFGVQVGFGGSPIQNQVKPEHITQILTNNRSDASENHDLKKRQQSADERKFYVTISAVIVIAITALAFVGFLTYLLQGQPEILKIVLPSLVSLIVGLVGGFGLGKIKLPGSKDE